MEQDGGKNWIGVIHSTFISALKNDWTKQKMDIVAKKYYRICLL